MELSPANKIWLHTGPDGPSISAKIVFRLASKRWVISDSSQNAKVYDG